VRKDLTALIGLHCVTRDDSPRLYELEEQAYQAIKLAAEELRTLLTPGALAVDEAGEFSMAEVLFALLDYMRPVSLDAATAFLRYYGMEIRDSRSDTKPV
jgi:hypothetical protein